MTVSKTHTTGSGMEGGFRDSKDSTLNVLSLKIRRVRRNVLTGIKLSMYVLIEQSNSTIVVSLKRFISTVSSS